MKEITGLGKRLYELRNGLGLTQVSFAKYVGLTQASISYYESGGIPNAEALVKISDRCNISIDGLLKDKKEQKIDCHKNPELENLCNKYLLLPKKYKNLVQQNIAAYLKAENKNTQ